MTSTAQSVTATRAVVVPNAARNPIVLVELAIGSTWTVKVAVQRLRRGLVMRMPTASDGTAGINVPPAPTQLTFRHSFNLEASNVSTNTGFDGGVLEIKIGSDPFIDIIDAGGSFTNTSPESNSSMARPSSVSPPL